MNRHLDMEYRDMEYRNLPIYFESTHSALVSNRRFGKITGVHMRTRCTRRYSVQWSNGETCTYKGARTRPSWIRHIFKSEEEWVKAKAVAQA